MNEILTVEEAADYADYSVEDILWLLLDKKVTYFMDETGDILVSHADLKSYLDKIEEVN